MRSGARLDFDDVVRSGFALTGRGDADIAGALTMFGEVGRAKVTKAALDAAGEGAEDLVDRTGNFLEGFDAFGGDLAELAAGGVAVTGGRALAHGFVRTHAAVFLISLAVDLHQLARSFSAAGEQAAEDDRVGERERLDDVAALRDAAVGEDTHALLGGGAGSDVKRGELRDADAGDDARRADGAGALADLDGIGAGRGEEFDAFAAGDVAGDEGDALVGLAENAERVADALGVAVGGRDREGVRAFVDERGRAPRADEQRTLMLEQQRAEDEQARSCARGVLVADPAALMTAVYSLAYFDDDGLLPDAIALAGGYDLIVWCDTDLPWVPDGAQRDGPGVREREHVLIAALVRERLAPTGVPVLLVSGPTASRIDLVLRAWQPRGLSAPT